MSCVVCKRTVWPEPVGAYYFCSDACEKIRDAERRLGEALCSCGHRKSEHLLTPDDWYPCKREGCYCGWYTPNR